MRRKGLGTSICCQRRDDKVSKPANLYANSRIVNEKIDMHDMIPSTSAVCVARKEPGISIVCLVDRLLTGGLRDHNTK